MLDKISYSICRTQGDLYEWAADNGYIFPDFSDIYMASDFCRRSMDTVYSRFQLREPEEHMDFLVPECPILTSKRYDGQYFDGAIAYWIGFTYRQLWFETGISSAAIAKAHPFQEMCRSYPGLHTLDEDMAADIILGREGPYPESGL